MEWKDWSADSTSSLLLISKAVLAIFGWGVDVSPA
jgi:hypothetical protein